MGSNAGFAIAIAGLLGLVAWLAFRKPSHKRSLPFKGVRRVTNEEVWTWVDWQGKERKIVVHRTKTYS